MKDKYLVQEMCAPARLSWQEFKANNYKQTSSLSNHIVRSVGVAVEHDFDRMQDICRFHVRAYPLKALNSSVISPQKRVLDVILPDRGTSERAGADAVICALASLLSSFPTEDEKFTLDWYVME